MILSLQHFAYIDSKCWRREAMSSTRQDAWTEEEDQLLVNTVLQYIREGKTQLEAFKKVAEHLSRTPAACGFRWNATLRKQYTEEIQQAKEKRGKRSKTPEKNTIDSAILLLKEMKQHTKPDLNEQEQLQRIEKLKIENEKLRKKLQRYDEAWEEMGKLWSWVRTREVDRS